MKKTESHSQVGLGKALAILPSTYGLIAWTALVIFLSVNTLGIHLSAVTWAIIAFTMCVFITSMLVNVSHARSVFESNTRPAVGRSDIILFAAFSVIGFAGLYIYINDFSVFFGGVSAFFGRVVENTAEVRSQQAELASIGTQLSYFSWLSLFFGLFIAVRYRQNSFIRIVGGMVAASAFALNLLFVDRTRPTWLFIVCALALMFGRAPSSVRVVRSFLTLLVVPLLIFVGYAIFSQKYNQQEGVINEMSAYILGGISYFDSLLLTGPDALLGFDRTFLPIAKILEALGFIHDVPSEILDFRYVPFATNVGTFLQPLYEDGGLTLVIIATPLIVLGIDWLALVCFRERSLLGLFMWANLIFIDLFSFFVPRYQSAPIYLFGLMFLVFRTRSRRHRTSPA